MDDDAVFELTAVIKRWESSEGSAACFHFASSPQTGRHLDQLLVCSGPLCPGEGALCSVTCVAIHNTENNWIHISSVHPCGRERENETPAARIWSHTADRWIEPLRFCRRLLFFSLVVSQGKSDAWDVCVVALWQECAARYCCSTNTNTKK